MKAKVYTLEQAKEWFQQNRNKYTRSVLCINPDKATERECATYQAAMDFYNLDFGGIKCSIPKK